MCTGEYCSACSRQDPGEPRCTIDHHIHDRVERHAGQPAIDDRLDDDPIESRVPTKPLPPVLGDRIELHIADAEDVAHFLRSCANIIEITGGISLIAQGPSTTPIVARPTRPVRPTDINEANSLPVIPANEKK